MNITGEVVESTGEQPVDDYADNDATEDQGDVIADLGNFTITDGSEDSLDSDNE